ncbi:MAG: transposase [Gammaproteobacteria bacterium]|nr:transposase [Gammaproteobacteria bacterium]
MTRPRCDLIDREDGGFYHLYDRCVRQAWLCGEDPYTGENYDHRREWIEHRMLFLTEIFPVDIYAYAVMSNHYHMVVNYCPARACEWSDAEVARRWSRVFGPRSEDPGLRAVYEAALLADPVRLAEIRQRLGDLSWYMRCLNEHIARRANAEEDRTGRFWDGRFESRPLADAQAIHACMVYNDLNPLRAGMVDALDAPQRTSLRRRLEEMEETPSRLGEPLRPLQLEARSGRVLTAGEPALETTLSVYLAQVQWTASRCQGERTGTDPPMTWRGSDTWLKAFAAQRRRGWRRGGIPAWLVAIA